MFLNLLFVCSGPNHWMSWKTWFSFFSHREKSKRPKIITTSHMRTFTPLIGQLCLGRVQERKHRKTVLKKVHWPNTTYYVEIVQVGPQLIFWLVVSNCSIRSSAPQHAKHTWLQEPFCSNSQSIPSSWIGSRSDYIPTTNKQTETTSYKGSWYGCFGLHLSMIKVFRAE